MRLVLPELERLWPSIDLRPASLLELPAWSTIFTHSGLLFCPLQPCSGMLIGIGAYVQDDGMPHHWGTFSQFLGDGWQKVLRLDTSAYIQATGQRGALISGLGRLAAVRSQDIAAAIPARSPQVLAASAPEVSRISQVLDVPPSALGLYGSALYKPPERRSDLDFVVYGEIAARRAHRHVRELRAEGPTFKVGSVSYHLRFRLPGSDLWYDPRYWRSESYTTALVTAQFTEIGTEDIRDLEVTDDSYGIFTPSVYGLADGTRLLSYRLGHAAYLQAGDKITAHRIPVLDMCGSTYRAILGYENLQKEPN